MDPARITETRLLFGLFQWYAEQWSGDGGDRLVGMYA
jgi:hypothetical protein